MTPTLDLIIFELLLLFPRPQGGLLEEALPTIVCSRYSMKTLLLSFFFSSVFLPNFIEQVCNNLTVNMVQLGEEIEVEEGMMDWLGLQ